MNNMVMKGAIAALLILFYNVWSFIFGGDLVITFWITYAYTMLAAILASVVLVYVINDKPVMLKTALSIETVLYLAAQLIAGNYSRKLFWLFPRLAFLLQLGVLTAYAVVILFTIMHNSQIKDQQQVSAREQMNFRFIIAQMKTAVGKMEYSNPQRKLVMHAYDALASGQIASNPNAAETEQEILSEIEALSRAITDGNQEKITQVCANIEELAAERKQKLSMMNPF